MTLPFQDNVLLDAIIYFFILEVAGLVFIKIFWASVLRKKPLSKLAQTQQINPKEQVIQQQKALFREYLQTQKLELETSIKQEEKPRPRANSHKRHRKTSESSKSEKPTERAFREKQDGASPEKPIKECPYSFRHLGTIKGLFPENCLICPIMLECRNKSTD